MKPRWLQAVVLAGAALALAACGGDDGAGGSATVSPVGNATQGVVVTRDDDTLPRDCRPRAIGEALVRFTDALRDANTSGLRGFWRAPFEWFSWGGPGSDEGVTARSPADALGEVTRRGGLAVTLREVEVEFTRSWGYPAVDIVYTGIWGDELPLSGKGFVVCRSAIVRVWSMAIEAHGEPAVPGSLCPAPRGSSETALVACVRQGGKRAQG
jgi:hypothetical protein